MKVNAFVRYNYTAELWDFEATFDAGLNPIIIYSYKEPVEVSFAADPNAPRMVFHCNKPIKRGCQIRDIKDVNGEDVMPGGWYTITTVEPVLSVLGTRDGFILRCALANEPEFE